jgi:hypothetical protein
LSPIQPTSACLCDTLPDFAVIPMGFDDLDIRVFATLDRLRDHGGDPWWLYLSRCSACRQHWMVAQEERVYDDYFLKRLDAETATGIVDKGIWPADFLTYEQVLTLGRTMSTPPRFHDAFAYSLQFTVEDLRKARPAITANEIAYLLGLTDRHARLLFWKVRLFGAAKLPN